MSIIYSCKNWLNLRISSNIRISCWNENWYTVSQFYFFFAQTDMNSKTIYICIEASTNISGQHKSITSIYSIRPQVPSLEIAYEWQILSVVSIAPSSNFTSKSLPFQANGKIFFITRARGPAESYSFYLGFPSEMPGLFYSTSRLISPLIVSILTER